MYPAKFEYAAPNSLQEAVGLLEDPDAKLLAGGHSLLPLMKLRLAQPKLLVDIGRIPGLSYVRVEGEQLAIGALTTYRDLRTSEELSKKMPSGAVRIAESGIKSRQDIDHLRRFGFHGFLVGESLLRQNDRAAGVRRLLS